MRTFMMAMLVLLFAGITNAADEKKFDAKMLIGQWEMDPPRENAPKTVLEFAAGGKLIVHVTINDQTTRVEGTYKLEGDKLAISLPVGGKDRKNTYTLSKLTDEQMVYTNLTDKVETLKKIKPKN